MILACFVTQLLVAFAFILSSFVAFRVGRLQRFFTDHAIDSGRLNAFVLFDRWILSDTAFADGLSVRCVQFGWMFWRVPAGFGESPLFSVRALRYKRVLQSVWGAMRKINRSESWRAVTE